MTDGTWIDKEAGWGVLPQLIPGQYSWVPHYRESYNIPDKEWDADSDAIYRESLPATFNYRTWESAKAPAVTQQPQAVTPAIPSDEEIVNDIIRNNKYGTGNDRIQALTNLGLSPADIKRIQGLVNARMYAAQARPAKHRKPAAVPTKPTFRPQERVLYQGMPMTSVGQHDPEYIYVR